MELAACALLLLAACPSKGAEAPTQPQGAGCPAGNGVFVASYAAQDATAGRSGWVVPLHANPAPADSGLPAYGQIDAATAAASGVPVAPTGTVWLATPSAPPCRAKVGSYYAARFAGPPATVSYGFELDGCPAPTNPEEGGGILLVSPDAPTACQFETPRPVSARVGTMSGGKWIPPANERPIPPEVAPLVPHKDCAPPGCEKLWAFSDVEIGDKPVAWSGAVNWLTVGDPATPCAWTAERFSGFFVPGPAGAVQVTEGQDHPLVLSAVLADAGGAKVLLAEGPGTYATYDLASGAAKLAHMATWMFAPPEAWEAVDHIGPVCERAGATSGAPTSPSQDR
jgi:hypothetical protein